MTTIIAEVAGEQVEVESSASPVEAVTDFIAKHFCGEYFYTNYHANALGVAEHVLAVNKLVEFDGFRFKNAFTGEHVKIEIVV